MRGVVTPTPIPVSNFVYEFIVVMTFFFLPSFHLKHKEKKKKGNSSANNIKT